MEILLVKAFKLSSESIDKINDVSPSIAANSYVNTLTDTMDMSMDKLSYKFDVVLLTDFHKEEESATLSAEFEESYENPFKNKNRDDCRKSLN
ncbi:hypothetical protein [Paenisporosarcina sp. TG-14]|uniref:hypothetical protein n=1 Tax=Paenisporosarcina sp. TG-14 TaxID=1231057 RepID=UPI00036A5F0B|nr:hypothetical protein [Paenisporosarcina sp. TG-14]